MKTMQGLLAAALSNISLTFFSLSPMYMLSSSGPFTLMNPILHQLAMHFPSRVFPVPGGPKNRSPVLGLIHQSKISGCLVGNKIVCMIYSFAFSRPPTSSQVTFLIFSTFSMLTSLPIYFRTCSVYSFYSFFPFFCKVLRIFEKVTHPRLFAANLITQCGFCSSIDSFSLIYCVTFSKISVFSSLLIQNQSRLAFFVISNLIEKPLKPMIRTWLVSPLSPKLKKDSYKSLIILFIFSCSSFFSLPSCSSHSMFLMQITVELQLQEFLILSSSYPSVTKYLQLILTKEQS